MEDIFSNLEYIKEKVELVKENEYREIFDAILGVISQVSTKVEENILKQESLEEYIGYIGEDLTDIQEELFEEVSIDDLSEMEDEYVEINCSKCGKPLFIEKQSIENNTVIPCPFCNKIAN